MIPVSNHCLYTCTDTTLVIQFLSTIATNSYFLQKYFVLNIFRQTNSLKTICKIGDLNLFICSYLAVEPHL